MHRGQRALPARLPSQLTNMLSGLMSRCTRPSRCSFAIKFTMQVSKLKKSAPLNFLRGGQEGQRSHE